MTIYYLYYFHFQPNRRKYIVIPMFAKGQKTKIPKFKLNSIKFKKSICDPNNILYYLVGLEILYANVYFVYHFNAYLSHNWGWRKFSIAKKPYFQN